MKDNISFDEFVKMDLRVGEVVSVEKVERSEKLLKIKVDLGEELGIRQVISGIAKFYSIKELEGKQAILIINLEPRKIMGLESQGMILAGGEEEVSLLTVDKKIKNGTEIR